jgi:uncharacterized protein YcbK (DUF882 family)
LQDGRSRKATGEWRIVLMAIISALVASCSPITDPQSLGLTSPSLAGAEAGAAAAPDMTASDMNASDMAASDMAQGDPGTDGYAMSDQPEALPETIDYTPVEKPTPPVQDATAPAADAASTAADPTVSTAQAAQAAASDAQAQSAAAAPVGEQAGDQMTEQTASAGSVPVPADYPVVVTATDPDQAFAPPPKKKSFFASLFSTNQANATPVANQPKPKPIIAEQEQANPIISSDEQAQPLVTKTSARDGKPVKTASLSSSEGMIDAGALPGVRQSALFEIKRKSGLDDDSDVDVHEDEDWGPVNVATAGGLARLAPNGLVRQTDQVDVACLKPSLVRVLKTVEGHYGRKLVVTSGYRSPERNRRARGAKNSLHMYCAAADIQVPGVTKWELASYFRTMPGRGGVGTYCHTESVHIDVGPERDWNWRCRRRRS